MSFPRPYQLMYVGGARDGQIMFPEPRATEYWTAVVASITSGECDQGIGAHMFTEVYRFDSGDNHFITAVFDRTEPCQCGADPSQPMTGAARALSKLW